MNPTQPRRNGGGGNEETCVSGDCGERTNEERRVRDRYGEARGE